MTRKSGHQLTTKSRDWTSTACIPCITLLHRQADRYPLVEGLRERRDDLVGRRELHAAAAPDRRACPDAGVVEAARCVLDEAHAASALEQPEDRRVVADIGRDAEEDHLVGVESLDQP